MGGSSSQVVGYRYYAKFAAFIGNRIEKLIGINFDKRGWHTGRRVPMGNNGEMAYLHLPDLYGENEGGISGTLCVKYGSNMQAPDAAYKKYMESISSFASAYPYQSYISFTGSELLSRLNSLTEEQLQDLADQYNDRIVPGQGFYLGNSGYMKEMLLWVKRTRVRNDGSEQWYKTRADGAVVCEIGATITNGVYIDGYVDKPKEVNNGIEYGADWQHQKPLTEKSGTTKISIKYSSSTDITLEVRSLLWSSIVSTSISSNAIQGSLSKIET